MPTDRQVNRLLLGNGPYAPQGGYGGGSLQAMLLEQGRMRADAAMRSGELWGNALQQVGQQVSGAILHADQEKKLKKRDAAWLSVVNDPEVMKDPRAAYAKATAIWGPEDGQKQFQALAAVHQLGQPKRDQAADTKALIALHKGFKALDPATRAATWGVARPLIKSAFGTDLPEQYDDKQYTSMWGPAIDALEGPGKLTEVSPGASLVNESGEQVYTAPAKPAEKKLQTVETAEGIRSFDPSTGEMGPVLAKGRPTQGPQQHLQTVETAEGIRAFNPATGQMGPVLAMGKARDRSGGRPMISGDANRIADFDTSLDDLATLSRTITGSGATGALAKAGALLPNVVTEVTGLGSEAKSKQATIDRVKQVIGKTLEGGVLRKEDEAKYERILPTIADPPEVVKAKLDGLDQAIRLRRQRLVESLGSAGYDVGGFDGQAGTAAPGAAPSAGSRKNPFR